LEDAMELTKVSVDKQSLFFHLNIGGPPAKEIPQNAHFWYHKNKFRKKFFA